MDDDIVLRGVKSLVPHPKNGEIYGPVQLDDAFIVSVRELGILQPLRIATDGTVLAGHRRLAAAKEIGMEVVPCQIHDDSSTHIRVLVETNNHRHKTGDILARELLSLKEAGEDLSTKQSVISPTRVSEAIGVERDTARRVIAATSEIEAARADGRDEDADDIFAALKSSPKEGHDKARQVRIKQAAKSDHLVPILALAGKFTSIASSIIAIDKELTELSQEDGGQVLALMRQEISLRLVDIATKVRGASPATACPSCHGDGCAECNQMGWINRSRIAE